MAMSFTLFALLAVLMVVVVVLVLLLLLLAGNLCSSPRVSPYDSTTGANQLRENQLREGCGVRG